MATRYYLHNTPSAATEVLADSLMDRGAAIQFDEKSFKSVHNVLKHLQNYCIHLPKNVSPVMDAAYNNSWYETLQGKPG